MHTHQYSLFFILLAFALPLNAQNADTTDRSATQWHDNAERKDIKASALPTQVLKSFETSEFSDMNIVKVHKVIFRPGEGSETSNAPSPKESNQAGNEAEQDTEVPQRDYRIRDERQDIAETYYQDTYNQLGKPTDSLTFNENNPDTEATYFEIQVKGEVSAYRLFFNDRGDIRHTEIMDM